MVEDGVWTVSHHRRFVAKSGKVLTLWFSFRWGTFQQKETQIFGFLRQPPSVVCVDVISVIYCTLFCVPILLWRSESVKTSLYILFFNRQVRCVICFFFLLSALLLENESTGEIALFFFFSNQWTFFCCCFCSSARASLFWITKKIWSLCLSAF